MRSLCCCRRQLRNRRFRLFSSGAENLEKSLIFVVSSRSRNLENEVFVISERNLMKFSNFIF
ncbi:MAG: hypothetical protein LBD03_08765 [Methanobrevibacter sp.]|nr:hypothetical protein [Candidatus Methanovirga procula]